jgi:hypothetical protein
LFEGVRVKAFAVLGFALALGAGVAQAKTPVTVLSGEAAKIEALVAKHIDVDAYRSIKVQTIKDANGRPDYLLVHLLVKGQHRVRFAKIPLKLSGVFAGVQMNYRLQPMDLAQQPQEQVSAHCPDESIEFIAFCPNDDDLELRITKDVAEAARAKNLKVVELLVEDATRQKYLDYMSCPKLRGNFYDGDADPTVITTNDGVLSNRDIATALNGKFRHAVTNIWLACEAFNDPIKSVMIKTAASRKYAAGINDLEVGPSDEAAACTMKAALDGQPMTAAFKKCYDELDTPDDKWGFEGDGSDKFWD